MDYNDEMKRLGEHPAMKEIPESFDDDMAAGARPPRRQRKAAAVGRRGANGGAILAAIGAVLLAGVVFWISDTHFSHAKYADARQPDQAAYGVVEEEVIVGEVVPEESDVTASTSAATAAQSVSAASDAASGSAAVAQASPDAVYLFPTDGSAIGDDAALNAVAKEAVAENADVVVKAYTDETGNTAYNQRLSVRRAKAVGDYLVAHGVSRSHIHTEGCGPTHAFANDAQDRRAEVR
ncbi:MAG: OmpA family protein, partial [Muribaculaceae bacterium]|nr:OmpA family protein [Muribaculaceae bacterium]